MMGNKIFMIALIWVFVILAYVILAITMPAAQEIISTANASMAATANMSQLPGTLEATNAFPVYVWVIPGFVGVVFTAINLKKG